MFVQNVVTCTTGTQGQSHLLKALLIFHADTWRPFKHSLLLQQHCNQVTDFTVFHPWSHITAKTSKPWYIAEAEAPELMGWGGERNEIWVWDCLADYEGGKTVPDNRRDVSPASAQTILSKDFMTPLLTPPAMEALKRLMCYPVQCVCEAKPSQREGSRDSLSNTLCWDIDSDTALVRGTQTLSWSGGRVQMLRFAKGNWDSQARRGNGQHQCNSWEHSNTPCSRLFLEHSRSGYWTPLEPVPNTHQN